jgi:hypothetical protein
LSGNGGVVEAGVVPAGLVKVGAGVPQPVRMRKASNKTPKIRNTFSSLPPKIETVVDGFEYQ